MTVHDLATGGDPERALFDFVVGLGLRRGQLMFTYIAHDDGCPCVDDKKPMRACTCELVTVEVDEVTSGDSL